MKAQNTCLWFVVLQNHQIVKPIAEKSLELLKEIQEKLGKRNDEGKLELVNNMVQFESDKEFLEYNNCVSEWELIEHDIQLIKVDMNEDFKKESHVGKYAQPILNHLIN